MQYTRLESLPSPWKTQKGYSSPRSPKKKHLAWSTAFLTVLIIYFLPWHSSKFAVRTIYSPVEPSDHDLQTPRSNLHVFIPASNPDPNLCKAIVSANVLGYPNPTIINWNQKFDDPALVDGGSHLAKINGTAQHLYGFDESHDDDLVLIMDGYDAWIQLRPQTVVDRYFEINRLANVRIASSMESVDLAKRLNVEQNIVFGTQKRCWPWSVDDPPCYAVPESSLDANVYGPETDTDVNNEENPYIKYRQRYLNSGVVMGTVGAMRRMFDQALAQAPQDTNFGSDQYIFSHIFGDQELYREILRRDAGLAPREDLNEGHIEEVRAKAAARDDSSFDFGIGLDYGSEIGLNTVFAEDDTEWVRFSDEDQINEAQQDRGINQKDRRLEAIAADINSTVRPFQTSLADDRLLPRETTWEDVSLFTDVWTGISPVVIHHNAHRNGMKILRETWWPRIWFQKYLRALLDASGSGPTNYVAVGVNNTREYWPEEIRSSGDEKGNIAKVATSEQRLTYHDLCGAYDEELFRDGHGWL